MAFKPVNKEEMNKNQERISVNVEMVGKEASALKKLADETDISNKDLVTQMVQYCLKEGGYLKSE